MSDSATAVTIFNTSDTPLVIGGSAIQPSNSTRITMNAITMPNSRKGYQMPFTTVTVQEEPDRTFRLHFKVGDNEDGTYTVLEGLPLAARRMGFSLTGSGETAGKLTPPFSIKLGLKSRGNPPSLMPPWERVVPWLVVVTILALIGLLAYAVWRSRHTSL